jgi:hypothetical protein
MAGPNEFILLSDICILLPEQVNKLPDLLTVISLVIAAIKWCEISSSHGGEYDVQNRQTILNN